MEVEVSGNGGADWIPVETVGPVSHAGGGWYVHSFWLNDLMEPSSEVRLRFEASDTGPGSVVEAGIDDFTVRVLDCQDPFLCGDADESGDVNIDDAVYLIAHIFSGGPEPLPYESGDVDCSGGVDIDDVVWLVGYIFSGGSVPCDTDGDGVPDC
jgi:hypothetical protein